MESLLKNISQWPLWLRLLMIGICLLSIVGITFYIIELFAGSSPSASSTSTSSSPSSPSSPPSYPSSSTSSLSLLNPLGSLISRDSSNPPSSIESPMVIDRHTGNIVNIDATSNYKEVGHYGKPEVFNVNGNATGGGYRFCQAYDLCQRYGSRLATKKQIEDAYKNGANWCQLGWSTEQNAYHPTQKEQVEISKRWPKEFQDGCGQLGVNGGFYPSHSKLSVNCYGIKPIDTLNLTPWNTITKQWSQYSK